MAEQTVINSQVYINETEINDELDNYATAVNNELTSSMVTAINEEITPINLTQQTVIGNKYRIISKLKVISGEAELYLCEYQDKKYVAKVYRRERSIKQEVLDAIREIQSPYIATCYDTGEINGHVYEIIPYYKNGSLQGKKISYNTLRDYYIPCLNEALRTLHDHKIIHKDLKPSNIMINDDNKTVSIIDFGISSVLDSGVTMVLTNTGMTPIYSAPETYRNMFFDISDYYSLGITLYELYTGKLPYQGLSQKEMERYVSISRIPLPDEMPLELKELILGLTYGDITYRNNKGNPNRRWSYDEVNKWLQGIKLVLPGEGISENNLIPYLFQNTEYTSVSLLVKAMAENWNEGKKHLFRGYLTRYFSTIDPNLENVCQQAEAKASRGEDNDDVLFFEVLYGLDKRSKNFYWKGTVYYNLPAFGRAIIENLNNNQNDYYDYLFDVMSNSVISRFCIICEPNNTDRYEAVKLAEEHFQKQKDKRMKLISLYQIGYYLSGQKTLIIKDRAFNTISQFMAFVKELSNDVENSYQNIIQLANELCVSSSELSPQFEAWLIVNKQRDAIEKWRAAFNTEGR